ncbi:MAG: tetraacyldisaccharide 4'-kinase [Candidatus Adiutrix sp.]|jgi:tetraacyldisaccharide 4'-kinase|nr:tetraacyldisaccharide 4'-kinase [Candidatus Adiutrix sp.]
MTNDARLLYRPGWRDRAYHWVTASWQAPEPHWALLPAGLAYGGMACLRRLALEKFRPPRAVSAPVISLGNLTAGGSGKTPLCLALAQKLLASRRRPAILSRGYGRVTKNTGQSLIVSRGQGPLLPPLECGDEPWLLAASLPELRVVADANRWRGAQTALEQLDADILILDDGFQQMSLNADCRVLLLPAPSPLGNGLTLPAGPLREFPQAHRRADILVATGSPSLTPELLKLAGGRPAFAADYRPLGWRRLAENRLSPPEALAGRRVMAFCGLGRPQNFENSLLKLGLDIRRFVILRDHQTYDRPLLDWLGLTFLACGAEALVTTAKDATKLPADFALPLLVLEMEMAVSQASEFYSAVLRIAEN